MSEFCGAWKYVSCENFDSYLKELGINVILRKLALLASPTVSFDFDESTQLWTMRTETIVKMKSSSAKFKLNEQFQETTIDDRIVKTTFVIETDDNGNKKLVQCQEDKEGKFCKIERTICKDLMNVTMTINNVISTAIFKKITK